jgi:DsbE subfamily thiol:disulfide oxidoreductase
MAAPREGTESGLQAGSFTPHGDSVAAMAASPRLKVALLVLIPIAVVGALWAFRAAVADPAASTEVSGPMPAVEGPSVQGGRVTPADYRGRAVVVNFWASWCNPCRDEQPGLERLSREYEGRVAFIGVNHRDDQAAARAYLEEFDVSYPSVRDPAGELAYRFGVPWLPATVVVDASGEMRYRFVGAVTESTLRAHLEDVLG